MATWFFQVPWVFSLSWVIWPSRALTWFGSFSSFKIRPGRGLNSQSDCYHLGKPTEVNRNYVQFGPPRTPPIPDYWAQWWDRSHSMRPLPRNAWMRFRSPDAREDRAPKGGKCHQGLGGNLPTRTGTGSDAFFEIEDLTQDRARGSDRSSDQGSAKRSCL